MTQGFPILTQSSAGLARKALGKRIKFISEGRGISRADLAQMLDVTETRIARIFKGSSDITAVELIWTAKLLDCSLDQLAGR